MLLATGVYEDFVGGIAQLTRLQIDRRKTLTLSIIVGATALAILTLAGPTKGLVVDQRWVMYSLFIGLTLGGVPLLWASVGSDKRSTGLGFGLGLVVMLSLAAAQWTQGQGAGLVEGPLWMGVAGAAAASAMILPGVSGSYLLLLLGAYVPILNGVDQLKNGLRNGDAGLLTESVTTVVAPVGLGVLLGVLVVSRGLEWVIKRYPDHTTGALLGLLVGSVAGLWPFQRGVSPEVGDSFKGRILDADTLLDISPEDWPTELFQPSTVEAGMALAAIGAGLGVTLLIGRLGGGKGIRGIGGNVPNGDDHGTQ
jgi:putative membrane protein